MALVPVSCSDVEIPEAVTAEKVSNLTYTVNGRKVTLNWQNPIAAGLSGIRIIKNNTEITELDKVVDSYVIKRADINTDVAYTVKARYEDGRVSEGQTVSFNIPYQSQAKVGFLIAYNSVDEIEDDDEKAAAEWFQTTYPDGVILTPSGLDELYVDEVSTIWIQTDRVGLSPGWKNLPASLVSDGAVAALQQFVKDGGNLLLTKHATQLAVPIGRIPERFAPGIFGAGEGGSGADNWTMNAVIGSGQAKAYDHRSHPAFAGLETNPDYGHETYGLEGPGWREDHNCMWDLNAYGLRETSPAADNVVEAFEGETAATVLATWGHVADYCCAGIVEFNATADYPGKIIAIGLSSYEWNQNSGVNRYQANTERLTKNCIDYLFK